MATVLAAIRTQIINPPWVMRLGSAFLAWAAMSEAASNVALARKVVANMRML